MTNGLGATDVGNVSAIGGASLQFFVDVCSGLPDSKGSPCWHFAPHAALDLFERMLKVPGVTLLLETTLISVEKQGTQITSLSFAPTPAAEAGHFFASQVVNCSFAVDASYEGDLIAAANVSFALGRESREDFNESLAGVMEEPSHLGSHQFLVPVDTRWANGSLLPMISQSPPGLPTSPGKMQRQH